MVDARVVGVGLFAFVAELVAIACSSTSTSSTKTEPCTAGEALPCIAASGCDGLKVCRADGTGFSECACEDAGGGAGGSGGGAGGSGGGAGGSAGSAGASGGDAGVIAKQSCAGLPETCGASANRDCCSSPLVTGGTYNRSNEGGVELRGRGRRRAARISLGLRRARSDVCRLRLYR